MPLAVHLLLDFYRCDPQRLQDAARLRQTLIAAIAEAGGTYVTDVFHAFSPHGLSGIIVIAESHVAIHTWPEHAFAAADIFSCSPRLDHALITQRLSEWLQTNAVVVDKHSRGDKSLFPPEEGPGKKVAE